MADILQTSTTTDTDDSSGLKTGTSEAVSTGTSADTVSTGESVSSSTGGAQESSEIGASSSGASASQGAATSQSGSGMGSRLSNLRKYVQANSETDMASDIASNIEAQQEETATNLASASEQVAAAQAAEQARLTSGTDLITSTEDEGLGLFEYGNTSSYLTDSTADTTTDTTTDGTTEVVTDTTPDYSTYGDTAEDRLSAYEAYQSGDYTDATVDNAYQLQDLISDVATKGDLTGTEEGRFQLLREVYNRPDYTTGQQSLDQLILQADPEQAATLASYSDAASDLQQQYSDLNVAKQSGNEEVRLQAEALQAQIATQLYGSSDGATFDPTTGQIVDAGGVVGDFSQSLTDKITESESSISDQYDALSQMISSGYDIDTSVLQNLGVTDEDKMTEFLDYYSQGQGSTLGESASTGEFSPTELQAIADKTGTDYNDMLELYTATPVSIEDFASRSGNTYSTASADNKSTIENEYNQYVANLETESAAYKENLEGYVSEQLGDLIVEGPEYDYTEYLSSLADGSVTADMVASEEDFARQSALEQLTGLTGLGPLLSSDAGTVDDLGYGDFDINSALSAMREAYNEDTYYDYDSVTAPTIADSLTYGEQIQDLTETTTGEIGDEVSDVLSEVGLGQVAESVVLDPLEDAANAATSEYTEGLTDLETSVAGVGDVSSISSATDISSALGDISSSSLTGSSVGTATALEGVLTGGDNIANLSEDYTNVLNNLSYGDFDGISTAIESTYQLPEQLTSDAIDKVESIISEASDAVSNAWSEVTSWFCFLPGSKILMEDLTNKNIEDVMPGERIFGGETVEIAGKALSNEIYDYNGTEVSGSHPVFEDGKFIRVRDAKMSKKLDKYTEDVVVYTMCTKNNLMVVGGNLFTDFIEYTGSSLVSPEEAINVLNANKDFAEAIQGALDALLG